MQSKKHEILGLFDSYPTSQQPQQPQQQAPPASYGYPQTQSYGASIPQYGQYPTSYAYQAPPQQQPQYYGAPQPAYGAAPQYPPQYGAPAYTAPVAQQQPQGYAAPQQQTRPAPAASYNPFDDFAAPTQQKPQQAAPAASNPFATGFSAAPAPSMPTAQRSPTTTYVQPSTAPQQPITVTSQQQFGSKTTAFQPVQNQTTPAPQTRPPTQQTTQAAVPPVKSFGAATTLSASPATATQSKISPRTSPRPTTSPRPATTAPPAAGSSSPVVKVEQVAENQAPTFEEKWKQGPAYDDLLSKASKENTEFQWSIDPAKISPFKMTKFN